MWSYSEKLHAMKYLKIEKEKIIEVTVGGGRRRNCRTKIKFSKTSDIDITNRAQEAYKVLIKVLPILKIEG